MANIDRLRVKLQAALVLERKAMTRAIRAQTILEKHYAKRDRLQRQIHDLEYEAILIANRLLKDSNQ